MTPFFSVIIPVYNAEKYLAQCVDSLLGQDYDDFELLLVDDGSPDGSGDICDGYAKKDERVRVLHQENAGPTPARRKGLACARGEYVCFVDADDWVLPGYFHALKGYINQYDPDMVLFDLRRDEGPVDQPMYAETGFYDKARLEAEIYPYMLHDARRRPFSQQLFPGYLVTKVGRRALITGHYLADDRITIFEDVAMSYECVYCSNSVYITREPLYVYRQMTSSNLNHYRPKYYHEVNMVRQYLLSHLGNKSPALDDEINAFCAFRVIAGFVNEYRTQRDLAAAARNAGRNLDETGLARDLSFRGLPPDIKLFLAVVKLRLYKLAALIVKYKM